MRFIRPSQRSFTYRYLKLICLGLTQTTLLPGAIATPTLTQNQQTLHLQVVVNSNQDDPVQPDNALTLREAIQIVNGTLPLGHLSATVDINDKDRFSIILGTLKPGNRVSPIATNPEYGTSDPAISAVIRSLSAVAPTAKGVKL